MGSNIGSELTSMRDDLVRHADARLVGRVHREGPDFSALTAQGLADEAIEALQIKYNNGDAPDDPGQFAQAQIDRKICYPDLDDYQSSLSPFAKHFLYTRLGLDSNLWRWKDYVANAIERLIEICDDLCRVLPKHPPAYAKRIIVTDVSGDLTDANRRALAQAELKRLARREDEIRVIEQLFPSTAQSPAVASDAVEVLMDFFPFLRKVLATRKPTGTKSSVAQMYKWVSGVYRRALDRISRKFDRGKNPQIDFLAVFLLVLRIELFERLQRALGSHADVALIQRIVERCLAWRPAEKRLKLRRNWNPNIQEHWTAYTALVSAKGIVNVDDLCDLFTTQTRPVSPFKRATWDTWKYKAKGKAREAYGDDTGWFVRFGHLLPDNEQTKEEHPSPKSPRRAYQELEKSTGGTSTAGQPASTASIQHGDKGEQGGKR